MEHVYWNPTMETMPREQLRALQAKTGEKKRKVLRLWKGRGGHEDKTAQ